MVDSQNNDSLGAGDDPVSLERAVRIVRLMDLYGPLLTERQREFVLLHYEEDLSFGEIAREHGISRQAVHDAVKHAEKSLEEYEAKLEFSTGKRRRTGISAAGENAPVAEGIPASAPVNVAGLAPALEILEAVHDKLKRSGGVIYNADGLTRDVGDALDILKRLKADQNV